MLYTGGQPERGKKTFKTQFSVVSHTYVPNMIITATTVSNHEHQQMTGSITEHRPTEAIRNTTVGRVKQWRQAPAAL